MAKSYLSITPNLARQLKLIVADVDGTLTSSGDEVSFAVSQIIQSIEHQGIIVGLASGRPLTRLDPLAQALKITGPIIAENGAVFRLKKDNPPEDQGYSKKPAIAAFNILKNRFPKHIREAEDNNDRLVDIGFYYDGHSTKTLNDYLDGNVIQLLDSGYMLHLLQKGINKGKTLLNILSNIGNGQISPDNVIVFGDSVTDTSLFEYFKNNVLIINPRLKESQIHILKNQTKYMSEMPFENGFIQVSQHIINARVF